MLTTHNVPYALQHIRNIFKQQIRRSFCRSQPGNFKEQRTSWVGKPSTVSSNRKRLAGKSPAQQVEVGHFIGVGFSDVLTEPLSFRIEQRPVALVGIFVDLTMAYADKTSGSAESLPEPADAGKQVNIRYGFGHHAPFYEFGETLLHNQPASPLSWCSVKLYENSPQGLG